MLPVESFGSRIDGFSGRRVALCSGASERGTLAVDVRARGLFIASLERGDIASLSLGFCPLVEAASLSAVST